MYVFAIFEFLCVDVMTATRCAVEKQSTNPTGSNKLWGLTCAGVFGPQVTIGPVNIKSDLVQGEADRRTINLTNHYDKTRRRCRSTPISRCAT
jgi:hypothetical protein